MKMKKFKFDFLDINILASVLGAIISCVKGNYDCVFPWAFAFIGYVCAKLMIIQTQIEHDKNDELEEKLYNSKQDNEILQNDLNYYKSKFFSWKDTDN